jgi:hypothetical protein
MVLLIIDLLSMERYCKIAESCGARHPQTGPPPAQPDSETLRRFGCSLKIAGGYSPPLVAARRPIGAPRLRNRSLMNDAPFCKIGDHRTVRRRGSGRIYRMIAEQ